MTLNNRDGIILWLGAAAALVGYLIAAEIPPTQWEYNQWLQLFAASFAFLMGKLQTSPLKGENDL